MKTAFILFALVSMFSVVALRAQDDESAAPELPGVSAQQMQGWQKKVPRTSGWPTQQGPSDPINVIIQAKLSPQALLGEGWNRESLKSLADAITLGAAAVAKLHAQYPSAVADAYRNVLAWQHLDAELTNIEDSVKAGWAEISGNEKVKAAEFKRGCEAHQQAVWGALSGRNLPGMTASKMMIGTGLEHHVVIAFPTGTDWHRSGVVLDGWLNQSADIGKMVFPFAVWEANFKMLRVITPARLEY